MLLILVLSSLLCAGSGPDASKAAQINLLGPVSTGILGTWTATGDEWSFFVLDPEKEAVRALDVPLFVDGTPRGHLFRGSSEKIFVFPADTAKRDRVRFYLVRDDSAAVDLSASNPAMDNISWSPLRVLPPEGALLAHHILPGPKSWIGRKLEGFGFLDREELAILSGDMLQNKQTFRFDITAGIIRRAIPVNDGRWVLVAFEHALCLMDRHTGEVVGRIKFEKTLCDVQALEDNLFLAQCKTLRVRPEEDPVRDELFLLGISGEGDKPRLRKVSRFELPAGFHTYFCENGRVYLWIHSGDHLSPAIAKIVDGKLTDAEVVPVAFSGGFAVTDDGRRLVVYDDSDRMEFWDVEQLPARRIGRYEVVPSIQDSGKYTLSLRRLED